MAPEPQVQGAVYQVKVRLGDQDPVRPDPRLRLRFRMEEPGFLKNQDYQDCFEVNRPAATRALGDLVEERVLTRKEGTRSYQPGPCWEDWADPNAKRA